MATQSPQQVAAKWKNRTVSAVPQMKAGVQAVTSSPMEKAAARADEYLAGVQRAVTEGTYQAGLRSVSLQEWKDATAGKGADRVAAGAAAAEQKMADFMGQLLPVTDRVKQATAAMPAGKGEAARARMNAAFDMMSQFRYRKRS